MLPLFSPSNSYATLLEHPVRTSAHLPPPCHLPTLAASFSCSCVLAPLCMLHILCCHFADISIYYFLLLLRFTTRPSPTLVLSLSLSLFSSGCRYSQILPLYAALRCCSSCKFLQNLTNFALFYYLLHQLSLQLAARDICFGCVYVLKERIIWLQDS